MAAKWPLLETIDIGSTIYYQGTNLIGNKGCEYLSKASWPCLKSFIIGNNNI